MCCERVDGGLGYTDDGGGSDVRVPADGNKDNVEVPGDGNKDFIVDVPGDGNN